MCLYRIAPLRLPILIRDVDLSEIWLGSLGSLFNSHGFIIGTEVG